MKRILFVNDEMVVGGVARVLNNLLLNLNSDDYEIDLLILHPHGEMLRDIPKNVNLIDSSSFFSVIDMSPIQLIKKLKFGELLKKLYLLLLMKTGLISKKIKSERAKIITQSYDVEIAFKEGFSTIFTAFGDSKKKINWVHLDYKVQNYSANHMGLMKRTLKLIDKNVAVSKVAASSYQEVFELENEVDVIHNIIRIDDIIAKMNEETESLNNDGFSIISVGRFHSQKAFDRLIYAHSKTVEEIPHTLYLVGGGELEIVLKEQAVTLGVSDSVQFLGYQKNPFKYLKQADLFVLSSLYEGLPTVVFESFICGVPVLATRCAGIDEQVKSEYGYIVENETEALVEGLKRVLNNSQSLDSRKNNLRDYNYDNKKIIDQVESLFEV